MKFWLKILLVILTALLLFIVAGRNSPPSSSEDKTDAELAVAQAGGVARYQGLASRLEHLLYEISHPYRNWQLIISELRPFVLKNISHYLGHEQGPDCFALFSSIFLDALKEKHGNVLDFYCAFPHHQSAEGEMLPMA